jgi:hypothetical protein
MIAGMWLTFALPYILEKATKTGMKHSPTITKSAWKRKPERGRRFIGLRHLEK